MKQKTRMLVSIKGGVEFFLKNSISKKIKKGLFGTALLLTISSQSFGQPSLIVNGNFENNTPFNTVGFSWREFLEYNSVGLMTGPTGYPDPKIINWDVINNSVDLHHRSHGGPSFPMGVPLGGIDHHIDVNTNGLLRQSVVLAGSSTYNLSFAHSVHSNGGSGATATARVRIMLGTTVIATRTVNVTSANIGLWTASTLVFTTPTGAPRAYNLELEGQTSTYANGGVLFDNLALIGPPPACEDICYWKVTGNNILAPNRNIFGTLTNDNVNIQTNSNPVGIFTNTGFFGWGTGTSSPTGKFHVNITGQPFLQGIRFEGVPDGQDDKILCIDNDGNVHKRPYLNWPPGSLNTCTNIGTIPRTTSSSGGDMGCSQIIDDGISVGINTVGPFSYGPTPFSLDPAGSMLSGILTLDVNGVIRGTQVLATSDLKYKTSIKTLENSLNNVLKLNSVEYKWKGEQYPNKKFDNLKHSGFIAQELQKVLPNSVIMDKNGDFAVDYLSIIPVLTQAIQEQQKQIDELKSALKTSSTASNGFEDISKDGYLAQNVPNPFSVSTNIQYELPKGTENASIGIYDMNGKEIKLIQLSLEKTGNVSIKGGDLMPGMYLYTLIINGKYFDSKKMILTSQ